MIKYCSDYAFKEWVLAKSSCVSIECYVFSTGVSVCSATSDTSYFHLYYVQCDIMGEFSYECAKCGGHDQLDCESECVVKIGHGEDAIYLKGNYSGYGYVDAFVVTDGDKFVKFQTECISKGISLLAGYSKRTKRVQMPGKGFGGPFELAEKLPTDVGGFVIEVQLEQFKEHHRVAWFISRT